MATQFKITFTSAMVVALIASVTIAKLLPRYTQAKINTGLCIPGHQYREAADAIGPQHLKFYYWTLPKTHVDKLIATCGQWHGIWDGFGMDAHPLGFHVPRSSHSLKNKTEAMKECTFGRLFHTNQYAVLPFWRQQMLASPLRVDDVKDADVVLVDLVDDNCMSSDSGKFQLTAGLSRKALKMILEHLSATGIPHIVPLSKYEIAYYKRKYGGAMLAQPGAERLTYINYEITDKRGYGLQMPGRAPGGNKRNYTHYYVVPTPHPSTLHMYAHDLYFIQYLNRLQNEEPLPDPHSPPSTWPCYLARKTILVASSFSARYPVRKALKTQCLAAGPDRCQHVETSNDSNDFIKIMHDTHDAYGRAWFCLMPPGDTHSRRSFVDCLLQDAIPVIFRQITFDTIPFSDVLDPLEYVVYLPKFERSLSWLSLPPELQQQRPTKVLPEAQDILGLLEKRYPLNVRMKMVTNIFKIKHLYQGVSSESDIIVSSRQLDKVERSAAWLQTMIDPQHEVVRFDQLNEVHCLEDSFTGTLKAALRNVCRRGLLPEWRCKGQLPQRREAQI